MFFHPVFRGIMDQFQTQPNNQYPNSENFNNQLTARLRPLSLDASSISNTLLKTIIEKRLTLCAQNTSFIIRIDDSAVSELNQKFSGNLHKILGCLSNCISYAAKVLQLQSIDINAELVKITCADIEKTIDSESDGRTGAMDSFSS